MPMLLADVLKGIKFHTDGDIAGLKVSNISDDSRRVSAGGLFIAKRGYSQDGSRFIDDAIKNGARFIVTESQFSSTGGVIGIRIKDSRSAQAILADNFYGHPSDALKMIGVTGTNGKTTISYVIEGIIKASGAGTGVIGTINHRIKDTILPSHNTTPGPVELQSILSRMVRENLEYAVMEVSSHSLEQGRVKRVLFDVAIFSNLTQDHLDYHKTMDSYFEAKKRIFERLKPGGMAIINGDDDKVGSLTSSLKSKYLVYGTGPKADVKAEDIAISKDIVSFNVVIAKDRFRVSTRLIGRHNVSNVLASVAAATALGIGKEAIIEGIRRVSSIPGRLEEVHGGQPFSVFVDFAHTEDALLNVLNLLKRVAEKRILTVFGCGGNRDRRKRPLMGKVACKLSDHVIITSDNPRFEDPLAIIKDIEDGIAGTFSNYDVLANRHEAITRALELAMPDDIVLIAGKGHETCQVIKEVAMPFNDHEVAKRILQQKYDAATIR